MWIATYWMCINWQTTKLRSSVVPDDVPVDSTVRTHFSGPTSCGGAVFVGMWRGFFLCPLFIIYIHLYCDVLPGQHVHSTSHMFFHCSRQDPPPLPFPTHTYTQSRLHILHPGSEPGDKPHTPYFFLFIFLFLLFSCPLFRWLPLALPLFFPLSLSQFCYSFIF